MIARSPFTWLSGYSPEALRRNSGVWLLAFRLLRVLAFIEYNAASAAPNRKSTVSPSLG